MSTASLPQSQTQSPSYPRNDGLDPVTRDIARLKTWIVNLFYVGDPANGPNDWVLVDAGMPTWAGSIIRHAERRFGRGAKPRAIVLTHGHFDHVGPLKQLLRRWDVPVYAHELELPYITGQSAYPPPDPTVGGGMMARTSFLLPRGPFDFRPKVMPLPSDGSIPHLPGWRWIHTPGHTPGHVSLFRESDRALIAGDAFVTTEQEALMSPLMDEEVMHGPPMYFTQDWSAARQSVQKLADLDPFIAATGHGPPMFGKRLLQALSWLADDFDRAALPHQGRYVRQAVVADQRGTQFVPPPVYDAKQALLVAGMVAGAAALASYALRPTRRKRH